MRIFELLYFLGILEFFFFAYCTNSIKVCIFELFSYYKIFNCDAKHLSSWAHFTTHKYWTIIYCANGLLLKVVETWFSIDALEDDWRALLFSWWARYVSPTSVSFSHLLKLGRCGGAQRTLLLVSSSSATALIHYVTTATHLEITKDIWRCGDLYVFRQLILCRDFDWT